MSAKFGDFKKKGASTPVRCPLSVTFMTKEQACNRFPHLIFLQKPFESWPDRWPHIVACN